MANISCTVRPLVLTESAWFAISIRASVDVAIVEYISALPMLQWVLPLSLVSIPVFPLVHPIAFYFIVGPLPDVRVTKDAFPDAKALFLASQEFTVVYFPVSPCKNALAICFVFLIHAYVLAAICKLFKASAVAMFIKPFAFVNPATSINQDSKAVALLSLKLPFEKTFPIPFDSEVLLIFKLVVNKKLWKHLIIFSVLLCLEIPDCFCLNF